MTDKTTYIAAQAGWTLVVIDMDDGSYVYDEPIIAWAFVGESALVILPVTHNNGVVDEEDLVNEENIDGWEGTGRFVCRPDGIVVYGDPITGIGPLKLEDFLTFIRGPEQPELTVIKG